MWKVTEVIYQMLRVYKIIWIIAETKAAPTQKPKPQAAGKPSEEDFPHATRNKFLAAMVAIFAMLGYASLHGMIPVCY